MTSSGDSREQTGAVVIGADFQTLGVIRSLADAGIPVFLVENEWGIARRSRHVSRRATCFPLRDDPERGIDFLLKLAERENLRGWTVIPNDDETVKLLSQNRDRLSECYVPAVPEWKITQNIYYKSNTYRIAESIGIGVPKQYACETVDELLAQELRFPIVLKPSCKEVYYPATHKKAIRVDNEEELRQQFTGMAKIVPPEMIVVQELIPGGADHLYSCAIVFDGAESLAAMCANRRRQHPMDFGHATTFAESVDRPELIQLSTKLLRELGYRGIAEVEFMFDERDNQYKLIEINARPWGWNTLAFASGVNTPATLHQMLCGDPVETSVPRVGVKWIRLLTDTPTVLLEVAKRRMSVGTYLSSWSGKKEFAVFSLRDPMPFLWEAISAPYLWWKKGF